MSIPRWLTLIGALGLIGGAFLPWFAASATWSGESVTRLGIEGDGLITAGLGVVLAFISLTHKGQPGQRYSAPAFYLAALACLVGLLAYNAYIGWLPQAGTGILASLGAGLYLTIVGAFLAAIGTLLSTPPSSPAPASASSANPATDGK